MDYYLLELNSTKFILFDDKFGIEGEGSTPIGSFSPRETIACLTKGNLQKLSKELNKIGEDDSKAVFYYMRKVGKLYKCVEGLPQKFKYLIKAGK